MLNLRVPNVTLKRLTDIGDDIMALLHCAFTIPDLLHDIKQYKLRIEELESEVDSLKDKVSNLEYERLESV